ncbi:unnamed protein product [Bursaphelenchus okinawaensis]|uniref:Glycoprotein endo-alpha-1,2-mannosidase n=1 Tax=Bursaphelenchus okinawaensis TaxID=465554 RepID=A0A811JQI3_9BILA|nr:unnamed protein product [Bursaphelenchus okinawaensis]CAG9078534.1 unnamed protein product [Bursaphelenchus okinawaensis]
MNVMHLLKTLIAFTFVASFIIGAIFMIRSADDDEIRQRLKSQILENQIKKLKEEKKETTEVEQVHERGSLPKPNERLSDPDAPISHKPEDVNSLQEPSRPPSVHIFYYPWYGNPEFDHGKYYHWDHPLLLRTKPKKSFEQTRHKPPPDVASVFYPQLAAYSSRDSSVIDRHFKWISSAGIDVVAVSWYPKGKADDNGYPWEDLMPQLLNVSSQYKLKLAFHLEPYDKRTALSVRDDIEYIVNTYGNHSAFYKTKPKNGDKLTPVVYIYDSYRVLNDDWAKIALPGGENTIRGTKFDTLLIGLVLKLSDVKGVKAAGFDGIYTYFAADGFTEAASMTNWQKLSQICTENDLLFVPSIGPGYDDSRVRPWNGVNTRTRDGGKYYVEHFEAAHTAKPDIVSITSFNEWHEGTQIEPAISFTDKTNNYTYLEYEKGSEMYLQLTNEMIRKYFVPHHQNIPMDIAKIV